MRFTFTEDQQLFRDAARDLFEGACTPERLRKVWASADGVDAELWGRLAGVGVVGALASEGDGGLGMTEVDVALVLEEAGRVALPGPLVETAVVAVGVLRDAGGPVAEAWSGRLASGRATVAVGFADDPLVAHAATADLLLLEHEGVFRAVDPVAATIVPQQSLDPGRRVATVDWDVSAAPVVEGDDLVARARDRAAWGTAALLVGTCRRMIDLSVRHARERHQFGRPIGSFQAVKHHLADALLATDFSRPAVYNAAHAIATDAPTRTVDVGVAKVLASDAAEQVARIALQVHGAMGYTWEHDLHLWSKRALVLAAAHGDADHHRERVAERVLDA